VASYLSPLLTTRDEPMYAEPAITVRRATDSDVAGLAELMYRFYAFNEEFDPSWAVVRNLREVIKDHAAEALKDPSSIVLVAASGNSVLGYLRAALEENRLLASSRMLVIKELYVRPEHRRAGVATLLVNKAMDEARKLRASRVAVEFPSANKIAEDLYLKIGFRPYLVRYVKEV